ncbi:protein kinase domain-containing protein [Legionella cincinnatiensis]|uniref:Serine/threonine protein kinase n=1 Tax=Legionella cincinnatiensis TaxID=28085 RepID=A0A378ISU9_9GAMM|nr:hypothetical protein [Legionella cincinnatiensis]KTC93245.1 serine/threonine protein kinase [Legionella cincinnatiensis]STX35054.1 serine/threonine protein kinase [Legionella cincinnatiensis]
MLDRINNRKNDLRIDRLNSLIDEYNELYTKILQNKAKPLEKIRVYNVLEEINYAGNLLKKLHTDALSVTVTSPADVELLGPMANWRGIAKELGQHLPPPSIGLAAEMKLLNLTGANEPIASVDAWVVSSRTKSRFKKNVKESVEGISILAQLDEIHRAKNSLPPSDYFYKLQEFKSTLLIKLAFQLNERKDINNFRTLVSQINQEISKIIHHTPDLRMRYMAHLKFSNQKLVSELATASIEDMDWLKNNLRSITAINPGPPTKADIVEKFPGVAEFEITRLGGANNVNWRIRNEESGEQFVLTIGEVPKQQVFLDNLSNFPLNEYFSHDYLVNQPSSVEAFNSVVISNFAGGGDLYGERERKLAQEGSDVITLSACNRIGQLTTFCRDLLQHNGSHVDIKLTNFLLDDNGRLIVADKKGITPLFENRTLNKSQRELWTTPCYAPPEYLLKNTNIDAEAFNSYQLGLALYDYLILPPIDEDPAKFWAMQNPLNFDNPYFQTQTGQEMRKLINSMTDPDPTNRPKLDEVLQRLYDIENKIKNVQNNQIQILPQIELKGSSLAPLRVSDQPLDLPSSYNKKSNQLFKLLTKFEESLSNISSKEELQQKVEAFKSSEDYQILSSSRDSNKISEKLDEIVERAMEQIKDNKFNIK